MLKYTKCLLVTICIALICVDAHAHSIPGTNKYAWQSSLRVAKFLPLLNADPYSGVILSDWYSITPTVRYKVDIYVLSGTLSSSTVHVSVFKQVLQRGTWKDILISAKVASSLEEAILNTAKKLRSYDYED